MKLENCKIGIAVQSKQTYATGVIADIWLDGDDTDVEIHFNHYENEFEKIRRRVKPESIRKVKSLSEGKERVCVVLKNTGLTEQAVINKLEELGYHTDRTYYSADVIYGEADGTTTYCDKFVNHKYSFAHLYRDITSEVI